MENLKCKWCEKIVNVIGYKNYCNDNCNAHYNRKKCSQSEYNKKFTLCQCKWCEKDIIIFANSRKKRIYCNKNCLRHYCRKKMNLNEYTLGLNKSCKYCENNFKDKSISRTEIYCSTKCSNSFHNHNLSLKERKELLSNLTCQYCNNKFIAQRITQKYCSKSCSAINLYHKRRDHFREYSKNHRLKNIDRYRELERLQDKTPKRQKSRKDYIINNKEKLLKAARKNENKRYRTDILFNLKKKLRVRVKEILKTKNLEKNHKFKDYIGCSPSFLKKHLESLFTKEMEWDLLLIGQIHIDHIIPLDSAKNERELFQLSHYTNLQPLWAADNIKKSNKIEAMMITEEIN